MSRELHVELLLGLKVFDSEGKPAGRLEEIIAERNGDEWVVREYWVGPSALLYRFSVRNVAHSLLGIFGAKGSIGYRVPWNKIDFSRPKRLRLNCRCDELEELTYSERSARQRKRKSGKQ